jgi:hypothetical protein
VVARCFFFFYTAFGSNDLSPLTSDSGFSLIVTDVPALLFITVISLLIVFWCVRPLRHRAAAC